MPLGESIVVQAQACVEWPTTHPAARRTLSLTWTAMDGKALTQCPTLVVSPKLRKLVGCLMFCGEAKTGRK